MRPMCLMVFSVLLFYGCRQEKLDELSTSEGVGYIRLDLELDVAECGRTEAVNTDDWNVIVYYESMTEAFNLANFTDVPSEIELTPGDYTVFVSSEDQSVAFDNPFYTGISEVVTINSGDVVPVTVNASLANVEVSVSYSADVQADFTSMSTTVTSTSESIVFGTGEARSGYFVPGEDLSISADLTFTNPDLTTEIRNVTGTISGTSAQDHYQITIDYTLNGSISPLTITVDESTNDIPIVLDESPNFISKFGGSLTDEFYQVVSSSAGGYIAVGESRSSNSDLSGNLGFIDGWIVKTNKDGELEWSNNYGGS